MALGTNLASDIQAVLASAPASAQASANGLAQAYYNYTSTSQFGLSLPVITTAQRDAMATTLATALSASPGAAATAAAAYAAAVATFWTGVVVAGASGAGTVTGCPGASGLTASLSAVFAILTNTYATCAAGMATALATATLTCQASLVIPPNPPVVYPIS